MKRFALSDLPARLQGQVLGQLHPAKPVPLPVEARKTDLKAKGATRPKPCLSAAGLPVYVTELRFAPSRRWRFDYAWPSQKIALEVEGGVWTGGRHTRGAGFLKDCEKYNAAAVLGWRVVRCTPSTLNSPETLGMLKSLLAPTL